MAVKYATGKNSFGFCDLCSFRYSLKELKRLPIKDTLTEIRACPTCWNVSHPQLRLGEVVVVDPQALRDPRPDTSYLQSGLNGLMIGTGTAAIGTPDGGSRIFQWGWAPVGMSNYETDPLTPNYLVATAYVGSVTTS